VFLRLHGAADDRPGWFVRTGRIGVAVSAVRPGAGAVCGFPPRHSYRSRGHNQKGATGRHEPLFLTPQVIGRLRARTDAGRPVTFRRDVWPLITAEVRAVYYRTLIAVRDDDAAATAFLDSYRLVPDEGPAEREVLRRWGITRRDRWDWDQIATPYGDHRFADTAEYRSGCSVICARTSPSRGGAMSMDH